MSPRPRSSEEENPQQELDPQASHQQLNEDLDRLWHAHFDGDDSAPMQVSDDEEDLTLPLNPPILHRSPRDQVAQH